MSAIIGRTAITPGASTTPASPLLAVMAHTNQEQNTAMEEMVRKMTEWQRETMAAIHEAQGTIHTLNRRLVNSEKALIIQNKATDTRIQCLEEAFQVERRLAAQRIQGLVTELRELKSSHADLKARYEGHWHGCGCCSCRGTPTRGSHESGGPNK